MYNYVSRKTTRILNQLGLLISATSNKEWNLQV